MIPHTKYQGPRTYSFRKEDFFKVFYINLCKTFDPWGGDLICPRGIILNKLGRCPLGDATYQISMLYVSWFQTIRFFMFFFHILGYAKHVIPGRAHFFATGIYFEQIW